MSNDTTNISVTNFLNHLRKAQHRPITNTEHEEMSQLFSRINPSEYTFIFKAIRANMALLNSFLFLLFLDDGESSFDDLFYERGDDPIERQGPEEWLFTTVDECWEHQASHSRNDPVYVEILLLYAGHQFHSVEIRVSIVDPRPQIGRFLWDKTITKSDDPIMDALFCTLADAPVSCRVKQRKIWQPAPLFTYHPERYKQTRKYAANIPKALQSAGFPAREITGESINLIAQVITEELNHYGLKEPLREKLKQPESPMILPTHEVQFYQFHNEFVKYGRQIFDLNPPLVAMFRNTSVDDVPVNLLASPYQSYYLHFGKQVSLSFRDGWFVDGVYVQHIPELKLIQFLFTSIPEQSETVRHWALRSEPAFTLVIDDCLFSKSLGEATAQVLKDHKKAKLEKIAKGNKDLTDQLAEIAAEEGLDLSSMRIVENAETNGKFELEALNREFPVMQKALEIAVNAMCYLTAYPDDITKDWTSNAPRDMVSKATKGHPTIKKNTLSKLNSLGYQKISLCGRSLMQGPALSLGEDTKKVRQHWRKGHWKRQPYGPSRSLRKLVLIKPTLVNPADNDQGELQGHIYIGENVVDFKAEKRKRKFKDQAL